jgi:hypothetical protein
METIADLLPNEHILNFHASAELQVPTWLPDTLSLMVGAGDLDHDNMPNIQKFSSFDVFFCNAWDSNGSFRKNVEYLSTAYPQQKVICVIDHGNEAQVARFVELFRGRFHLIDGHLGHTPHLSISNLQKLLTDGGKAMNIYERSETMMEMSEMQYWFEHGHFKGGFSSILLTSSMYKKGEGRMNEHDKEVMWLQFLTKIQIMYDPNGPITYDPSFDLYNMSLLELQILLYCLQLNNKMPINMKGVYTYNTRTWRTDPILELVITKVEPDYGHAKIAACRDPQLQERANYIIDAIKRDADNDLPTWSFAKYKTLMRHLSSPKFEAACALE